jgi:hypothetical protein
MIRRRRTPAGKTERRPHFKRTFVRTGTSTRRMPKQKHYSLRRYQRICQVASPLCFRSRLALVWGPSES